MSGQQPRACARTGAWRDSVRPKWFLCRRLPADFPRVRRACVVQLGQQEGVPVFVRHRQQVCWGCRWRLPHRDTQSAIVRQADALSGSDFGGGGPVPRRRQRPASQSFVHDRDTKLPLLRWYAVWSARPFHLESSCVSAFDFSSGCDFAMRRANSHPAASAKALGVRAGWREVSLVESGLLAHAVARSVLARVIRRSEAAIAR